MGIRGSDYSVLGKTTLHKLIRKIELHECQCFLPPQSIKRHTFLDIKHLHNAWVVDAVSFSSGWGTAHVYLNILKFSSIQQILHLLSYQGPLGTWIEQNIAVYWLAFLIHIQESQFRTLAHKWDILTICPPQALQANAGIIFLSASNLLHNSLVILPFDII
jgi:hypothetical protein